MKIINNKKFISDIRKLRKMSYKGEWEVNTHYLKGDIVKIPTYKYFNGHRLQNGEKFFVCMISHISCVLVYPLNPEEIYWSFVSSSTNFNNKPPFNLLGPSEFDFETNNECNFSFDSDGSEISKLVHTDIRSDISPDSSFRKENTDKITKKTNNQNEKGDHNEKSDEKDYRDKLKNLDKQEQLENNIEDSLLNDLIDVDEKAYFNQFKNIYKEKSREEKTDEEKSDDNEDYLEYSIPKIITENEILNKMKETRGKRKFRSKLNEIQHEIRLYKKKKGDIEYNLEDKIMLMDVNIETKVFLLDKYESTIKNARSCSNSDYTKSLSWFKTITNIPFGKCKPFDVDVNDPPEKVNNFFETVKSKLDDKIYGLDYVKEEILEFLARKITNPSSKGHILALHGVAGVGKTKILKTLANALSLPFYQINFGGMSDSSILMGHSETYIGSKPGKIIEILSNAGCMNPIIYLDEIDKISDSKEREINGVLTHMLDEEQNNKFQDNYLSNVDIDLSQVFFVIAFNDLSKVNNIVSDRMKIIHIQIPTIEDKIIIASQKMIPEIIDTLKIKTKIVMEDDLIRYIILNNINNEEGVRQMKKIFEKIFNRINYLLLTGKMDRDKEHVIDKKLVDSIIKIDRKDTESHKFMYS